MVGPPFDVVVVGNVGIDTNVYLPGGGIDWAVEANFTDNLDDLVQAGGYASRGYARLGRRTAFVGHVGDDHHGRFVRAALAGDGIDVSALGVDPAGTARSVNLVSRDGQRKNFYDGKGHMTWQPDLAACHTVLAGARLAHVNIPNWARRLLPLTRELGVTVACDVQDAVAVDDPYRRDFVAQADILFFSAANQASPVPLIEAFLRARPDLIVVAGMGAQGCALGTRQGVRFFPPIALDLPLVDTNGAGDGLAVGFLTGYVLDRRSLEESIRRGQIVARYTCALKGSTGDLITADLLERYADDASTGSTP